MPVAGPDSAPVGITVAVTVSVTVWVEKLGVMLMDTLMVLGVTRYSRSSRAGWYLVEEADDRARACELAWWNAFCQQVNVMSQFLARS
jgi:hypothetical protein